MSSSTQSQVWEFITLYRKVTGEEIVFIRLMTDDSYRNFVLGQALSSGDEALHKHCQRLLSAGAFDPRDDQQGVVSPVEAGAGAEPTLLRSEQVTPPPVAPDSSQDQDHKRRVAEYRVEVRDALEHGRITATVRGTLDHALERLGLTRGLAVRVERKVRADLGFGALDWEGEFADSLEQLRAGNRLDRANRERLFAIYVDQGRISHDTAKALSQNGLPISPWGIAAGVGALLLAVVLPFVFGDDDNQPAAGGAAQVAKASGSSSAQISALKRREGPETVVVSSDINTSRTWRADTIYLLDKVVFVESGATLTIEPGTQIQGRPGSALVVARGATLYASGNERQPIVFTSTKKPGERQRGDWGGLVLLGAAPINRGDEARIEGVDAADPRGLFGGRNPEHNCGVLQFVRVEFAGYEVFADNELNGLTLGACGSATIVRNVQVHMALDDGIEIFGGTVDLRNIVITGAKDDSLDWDMGWTGRAQFVVIQQHPDAGDNGFEADNWKKRPDAAPISAPTIYNVTMVGALTAKKAQRGMNLRRGTGLTLRNAIVMGFSKEAIDVRDASARRAEEGRLSIANSMFFEIGKDGRSYFSKEVGKNGDDDGGFDEQSYFTDAKWKNRFGVTPLLSAKAYDIWDPDFTPLPHSPAFDGAADVPEGEFWDQAASYLGAVRPGEKRSWLAGWTSYPRG